MRTIKFRAFKRGCMDYNPELKLNSHADLNEQIEEFEDKDYILMQYTGMTDANGIEVYEGDVVEIYSYVAKTKTKGNVAYSNNNCAFFVNDTNFKQLLPLSICDDIKVIGNVYEDKELAK